MTQMWRLAQLQYDDGIPGDEVSVFLPDPNDPEGGAELEPMPKRDAIALAQSRGCHLVAEWVTDPNDDSPSCNLAPLALPPRWERDPTSEKDVDEALWFVGSCGGRDYLVANSHTFVGRMTAWCPQRDVGYSISSNEISECSTETKYWVAGFLNGAEPEYPLDDRGYVEDLDDIAWREATARFRRTGAWLGRWRTCEVCGCVLLLDGGAVDRCADHLPGKS